MESDIVVSLEWDVEDIQLPKETLVSLSEAADTVLVTDSNSAQPGNQSPFTPK